MPIKLPNRFNPRRKSSGNPLEEVPNPPQTSFRVFERPSSASKSFDGGNTLKRMSQGRRLSTGQYLENEEYEGGRPRVNLSNRGSGGTNKSSSSGGLYDTSSSSARFSSSSTLPSTSSIEATPDEPSNPYTKALPKPPGQVSQSPFSLRAAGRTFSFGKRLSQQASDGPDTLPNISSGIDQAYGIVPRPRAMTETSYASASTATPPRLLDTDLGFGQSDDSDGFGDMFEGIGDGRKPISRSPDAMGSRESDTQRDLVPSALNHSTVGKRLPLTPPPPINIDRTQHIIASPYSGDSNHSQEALMSATSPRQEQRRLQHYNDDDDDAGDAFSSRRPQSDSNPRTTFSPQADSPNSQTRQRTDSALRRSSAYASRRASTPFHDNDAMVIMGSITENRRIDRNSGERSQQPADRSRNETAQERPNAVHDSTYPQQGSNSIPHGPHTRTIQSAYSPVTLHDGPRQETHVSSSWPTESLDATPRAKKPELAEQEESLLYDPSFQVLAKSAEEYQARELSPPRQPPRSKVMTPAQFERYRKEQEMSRSKSNASRSETSESGSENNYDDDEGERTRQLMKQRRKQEAHLAVYRQQMMKVTGEQHSIPNGSSQKRPELDRASMSTPNLGPRMSKLNITVDRPSDDGKASDDEDEDIPLGILAAHGFPSKERPPTQIDRTMSTPTIRYTSETYPPPPASVVGGSVAGGPHGNLPPFARSLPKDPYYGASIVNPANREPPAFGNSSGGSVYGEPHPNVHPGGLVGVIASEERARAARRGSPNVQGGFGPSIQTGMPLPPGMMPVGMQPGMPPAPTMSPGDQAQIQMSQQMTQMMQMQMQWMQQMMAMQGMSPGLQPQVSLPPQMNVMNGSLLPPPDIQGRRPMSVGSNSVANPPVGQQNQMRTMSMLSPPSMGSQWAQQAQQRYAASAGPNMMSGGLGLRQDYAPSIAPSERSTVGQPSRYRPVNIPPIDETLKNSSRASTFSSATALQCWEQKGGKIHATVKVVGGERRKNIVRPATGSDDDEEEGWEEMKAKREKKKSSWRLKNKDDQGLGDIFYPGI